MPRRFRVRQLACALMALGQRRSRRPGSRATSGDRHLARQRGDLRRHDRRPRVRADVVVVGEQHDSANTHRLERIAPRGDCPRVPESRRLSRDVRTRCAGTARALRDGPHHGGRLPRRRAPVAAVSHRLQAARRLRDRQGLADRGGQCPALDCRRRSPKADSTSSSRKPTQRKSFSRASSGARPTTPTSSGSSARWEGIRRGRGYVRRVRRVRRERRVRQVRRVRRVRRRAVLPGAVFEGRDDGGVSGRRRSRGRRSAARRRWSCISLARSTPTSARGRSRGFAAACPASASSSSRWCRSRSSTSQFPTPPNDGVRIIWCTRFAERIRVRFHHASTEMKTALIDRSAIGHLTMDNLIGNGEIADRQIVVACPLPIADCPSEIFAIAHCQSGLSIADVSAIADYRLSIVH